MKKQPKKTQKNAWPWSNRKLEIGKLTSHWISDDEYINPPAVDFCDVPKYSSKQVGDLVVTILYTIDYGLPDDLAKKMHKKILRIANKEVPGWTK